MYRAKTLVLLTIFAIGGVCAGGYAAPSDSWLPFDGISRLSPAAVAVQGDSPELLELQCRVPGLQYEIVSAPGGDFVRLALPDDGVTGNIGRPELPVLRKLISIPYGATPALEVRNAIYQTISLAKFGSNLTVYPVQPPVAKIPGAREAATFQQDAAAYSADAFQLAARVTLGETGIIRGHRFVEVIIYPVDVNPAARELSVLRAVDVRLQLHGSDMALTQARRARGCSG